MKLIGLCLPGPRRLGRQGLWGLVLCGLGLLGCAAPSQSGFDHTHAALDSLLATHVADGRVDYQGLAHHRGQLQDYLGSLGDLDEKTFARFTPSEQLALLLNAYNAFTLVLILDHYPVASIQDIPGNWTEARWKLLGQRYSLDQIENEIIRPRYLEPRTHFALVCAARGCPPLAPEAYTGERLQTQLASAARGFARNLAFNRLDTATGTLYVSKIFQWYQGDFAAVWGDTKLPAGSDLTAGLRGLIGFFREYLGPPEAAYLQDHAVTISYLEYDWGLNAQTPDPR